MVVEFEQQGNIAIITLNRPDARNAVNGDVAEGIEASLDRYEADAELWVAILTARGTVFSAGADLKEIAAVNGTAVVGGCELLLACDMANAA